MVSGDLKIMTNSEAIGNWVKGASGTVLATLSTFQEQLDFWTRYSFVLLGGLLTVLSIIKLVKNWHK